MRVKMIKIVNFRLLRDVMFSLEECSTVIVGRNNSGKTSLMELFRRLLSDGKPHFFLEDFSIPEHPNFWVAYNMVLNGASVDEVEKILPKIEMEIKFSYDVELPDLGAISEFVIDLDVDSNEAIALVQHKLSGDKFIDFVKSLKISDSAIEPVRKAAFFRQVREKLMQSYHTHLFAVDPNNRENISLLDLAKLRSILQVSFINAQRGLDDSTIKEKNVISKLLERLFENAKSKNATDLDRQTAEALEESVKEIQDKIDSEFNGRLNQLIPAFKLFGYPGFSDPNLKTETILNVRRLLENHTKIHYSNPHGVGLPESYNGLGPRNLIYMLLQLLEFFKANLVKDMASGYHLVFIEEPEAHLHPQMQEVFVRKINEFIQVFCEEYSQGRPWRVQFVISTHSTHIANEAPFESIRYFLNLGETKFEALVKDLRLGLKGSGWENDREFLHKYLTLTRCDLFFSDKAILIEGPTERILMPKIIEKVDLEIETDEKLSSQYITVMEVGGAYAHHFFSLLEFLELRTLIVTDLDSVKANVIINKAGVETTKYVKCVVNEGVRSSNKCVNYWFNEYQAVDSKKTDAFETPNDLIGKDFKDKIKGSLRLTYQVPEEGSLICGRSFEDAFMLANPEIFELSTDKSIDTSLEVWEKAKEVDKTNFALEFALENNDWNTPKYLLDGLKWLALKPSEENGSLVDILDLSIDDIISEVHEVEVK